MLGAVLKGILGVLWAIARMIILEAIVSWLQGVILAAIVYPIGATGQMARVAFSDQQSNYNGRYLDKLRRHAAFGVLVLVVSWIGVYSLFGSGGGLVAGGIIVLIAVLGWFNRLVVPGVD